MNIQVALLNPARNQVQSLRRMSEAELADQLAAEPLLVGRLLPVVTPNPKPTGPAVEPQYTIREEDVLREWIVKPSYLRAMLPARLAERRYEVESGGVSFGGKSVATDERSQRLISAGAAKAANDPEFSTWWKTGSGQWMPVDTTQMLALHDTVFAHVQACFARERELSVQLAEATDAELPALRVAIETFDLNP